MGNILRCTKGEMIVLVIVLIFSGLFTLTVVHRDTFKAIAISRQSCANEKRFQNERDRISQLLNTVKQEYGIQSCQMLELKAKLGEKVDTEVSASGGWCLNASKATGGRHVIDKPLAEELSLILAGKTVASFGDGPGEYKKYIDGTKRVAVYDAFDGAPYGNETSGGIIKFLDLTSPQYGLPMYDWVMSLEVAEHIPQKYQNIYINNVVRHAKEGIILSWAAPRQGGLAHVNNRPLNYVINLLDERGFQHDFNVSSRLRNKSTYWWFQRNILVFKRKASYPFVLDDA